MSLKIAKCDGKACSITYFLSIFKCTSEKSGQSVSSLDCWICCHLDLLELGPWWGRIPLPEPVSGKDLVNFFYMKTLAFWKHELDEDHTDQTATSKEEEYTILHMAQHRQETLSNDKSEKHVDWGCHAHSCCSDLCWLDFSRDQPSKWACIKTHLIIWKGDDKVVIQEDVSPIVWPQPGSQCKDHRAKDWAFKRYGYVCWHWSVNTQMLS